MKNRKVILAALSIVVVGALVLAGGLVASNMGFKLNLPLVAAAGGVSLSGSNFVGLPYNQQVGQVTARDLFLDMQTTGAVQILNKHRKNDDQFEFYTFGGGSLPPNGWNLQAGEAYIAKVGANQNYIIVGSHNPGLALNLTGAGAGSLSGSNFYVHPYHGTAATAKDLFLEIGGSIQIINQHRKLDDQFEFYTFGGGSLPPNGWNLKPGEGYIVKVGSNLSLTPAHY